jgi:hypothetical protein
MKLPIAISLLALLTACASPTQVVEVNKAARPASVASAPLAQEQPVLDDQCASLAKMARAIAALRDAGVNKSDVQFMLTAPTDYPLDPMTREVYARTDITPAIGATNSYGVCVKVGYANMTAALKEAQVKHDAAEAQKAKDELAAKKKPATKPPVKAKPKADKPS